MKRILLLSVLLSCQQTDEKLQNALRAECGKDAVLVSYRMVGDNFLDTIRLGRVMSESKYFEEMARIKSQQAKSYARLRSLSTSIPSIEKMHQEDGLEKLAEMNLYIDSMSLMIRVDSLIRSRISTRKMDDLKFFFAKGVMMSGDTVWRLYDKDFRIVKVEL